MTRDEARLLSLAAAARQTIVKGACPLLMLSYVVWPTDRVRDAARGAR